MVALEAALRQVNTHDGTMIAEECQLVPGILLIAMYTFLSVLVAYYVIPTLLGFDTAAVNFICKRTLVKRSGHFDMRWFKYSLEAAIYHITGTGSRQPEVNTPRGYLDYGKMM